MRRRQGFADEVRQLVGPPRAVVEPAPGALVPTITFGGTPAARATTATSGVRRPTASDPLPPWAVTGATELAAGSGVLPGAAWAIQASFAVHLPETRLSAMLRVRRGTPTS